MKFTKEEKHLLEYLLENEIDKLFKRKATKESIEKVIELLDKIK